MIGRGGQVEANQEPIEIRVFGMPGPQGSKKFVGKSKAGRGIMVESSKAVKPWRETVITAFVLARAGGAVKITGPVAVEMTFTLPKPTSAPTTRVTYPCKKPDLSKLVRSTEDALTIAGAWEDDARVVELRAAKRYPNEGLSALPSSGAVIRIWSFNLLRPPL